MTPLAKRIWAAAIVLIIGYNVYKGFPRYFRRGGLQRVGDTQKEALRQMRRLLKSYCRHPETINEQRIRQLIGPKLVSISYPEEGTTEVTTDTYRFRFSPERRLVVAAPLQHVPYEAIGLSTIFETSASQSYLGDCNFTFLHGDIGGALPESTRGLTFLPQ